MLLFILTQNYVFSRLYVPVELFQKAHHDHNDGESEELTVVPHL